MSEGDRRRCLKPKLEVTKVSVSPKKMELLRRKGFYKKNRRVKIIRL